MAKKKVKFPGKRVRAAIAGVNAELMDRAVRHAVYLEHFKSHEAAEVSRILAEAIPEVLERLEAALGRGPSWSSKVLQEQLGQSYQLLRAAADKAGQQLAKDLKGLALTEAEWQVSAIRGAMPVEIALNAPSAAKLKAIVTDRPFEGDVLKGWYDKLGDNAAAEVNRQVKIGMAASEDVSQITKRLRGDPDLPQGSFGGTAGQMDRGARSVARTATAHVSNKAKEESYIANGDVLGGVIMVATLDGRTTLYCINIDGKKFPVNEGPRPPFHWGCRTVTAPVTKSWKELGFKKAETTSAQRASMNGEVPAAERYPEWLKKQPNEFQDRVLGKARAEMFRSGEVDIDRFIDEGGRKLTLAELRRLEGLP